MSNPSANATISDNTGVVTITDDDSIPTVSVSDIQTDEGSAESVMVYLSNPSYTGVIVNIHLTGGTATAEADYENIPSSFRITVSA